MVDEAKSERVQLLMTPSEVRAVDDWSFTNRIRGRSEAIRRLLELGLGASAADSEGRDRTSEIRDLGKEHGPGIVKALQGAAADGNGSAEGRDDARRVLKQHGHPAKSGG